VHVWLITAGLLAAALAASGSAGAHHSGAMFDNQKSITLTGAVRLFPWANPHCWRPPYFGAPFVRQALRSPSRFPTRASGRLPITVRRTCRRSSHLPLRCHSSPRMRERASLGGGAVATGHHPISATVDYSGRFPFVVSDTDSSVSTYAIDPSSGALAPVGPATITGPAILTAAVANDLHPGIDVQRRLMARWSCSTTLLR
jgi:hypothetical protein